LAARLVNAGPVRTVTLAPELPGGLDLTAQLAQAGLVVSCGHSDADAPTAHAAFDHGARAITHIHNAHRRWKPRDPGLGGVALVRPDVTVQAIVDGVHLAAESAYAVFLAAGPRFCLVTDAIEAAMRDARESELGGRRVQIRDGAVRLPDGTLAGSVLTMDEAVRNLVASGASLADAVQAASATPARLLGRDDLGELRPGAPAHVTVLDDELRVVRTLVGGVEAFGGGS
jgi:N-acetylglucosamine-6-phosphate deacetylase